MANSWRRERWDSLRLLTPNWQSRLPGYPYRGADPDGFMTMPEVVEHISGFAAAISAPLRTHTTVTSVRRVDRGYLVTTDQGAIPCRSLVLASGAANMGPSQANVWNSPFSPHGSTPGGSSARSAAS